jgi:hypothetical protein
MGMYSRITRHCISVRPGMLGRLKQCLKKHSDRKESYYHSLVEIKGKKVSLEKLDGHKIISYWYEDFCRFLKDIAQYIDGLIVFEFESDAEGPAYLWFEDGKVKIRLATWTEYTPEELIRIGRQMKAELDWRYEFTTFAQAAKKTANRSAGRHKGLNPCRRTETY